MLVPTSEKSEGGTETSTGQGGYVWGTGWIISAPTWGRCWCTDVHRATLQWDWGRYRGSQGYPTLGIEAQRKEGSEVKERRWFAWRWVCSTWKEWLQLWDLPCQEVESDARSLFVMTWIGCLTGKLGLCSHFKEQTFIWVGLSTWVWCHRDADLKLLSLWICAGYVTPLSFWFSPL